MRSLDKAREGWDEVARQEDRLAQELTIEQSVRIFLSLQDALAPIMDETEALFRSEREAYIAELQARLRRLDEWQRQHGTTTQST